MIRVPYSGFEDSESLRFRGRTSPAVGSTQPLGTAAKLSVVLLVSTVSVDCSRVPGFVFFASCSRFRVAGLRLGSQFKIARVLGPGSSIARSDRCELVGLQVFVWGYSWGGSRMRERELETERARQTGRKCVCERERERDERKCVCARVWQREEKNVRLCEREREEENVCLCV